MPTYKLRIMLACILLLFLQLTAFAGEDVELYSTDGELLPSSKISEVDSRETCGYCHDFDESALSVHFSRNDPEAEADYVDCLSCHIGELTSEGLISKTPAVPNDTACVTCHSDLGWRVGKHKGMSHSEMSCYDCHSGSGHKNIKPPACVECHSENGTGPIPAHVGFTKLHMEKIDCETCHITVDPSPDADTVGYKRIDGKIRPITDTGSTIHHGVHNPSQALGASGCDDCHSTESEFFYNTIASDKTDTQGSQVKLTNYQSMGYEMIEVQGGALREQYLKPFSIWLFAGMLVLCVLHYTCFGPRRAPVECEQPDILRFTFMERLFHFLSIFGFIILAGTGVMFLLHMESPYSNLRALHSYIGPIFVISLVGMLAVWWKNALFVSCDKDWVRRLGGYLWIKGECPAEKFNAGQKLFFWLIVVLFGGITALTGILLMHGNGGADSWVYTLHDLASIVLIAGIISHAYLSVFANPGTLSGIITGRVCRAWAKHHHPDWLKRIDHEQ